MAKEKITVAQAMVRCLEAEGINTVFGYPGAAICPFYDKLYESDIRHILVRHEANAGHSASGYARISGKPAVCVATSGPGATNLITAIATAYMDSIPMVIITGQVNSELIGRDVFQEADITGAAEPFVKHSYLVKNADEIAETFKKAFYISGSGRNGPVLIDVPMDVQNELIEFTYPESVEIRSYKPSFEGNKLQIKRINDALKRSKKPLICAGGGLFSTGGEKLMIELAEKCDIPVITTMMGIGSISTDHPLHLGMIGTHGKNTANNALYECDLLILLGARVGDRAISGLQKLSGLKVVHIDIDPAEIGKNLPATYPVVGDVKKILSQLLEITEKAEHKEWIKELSIKRTEENNRPIELKENYVSPRLLMKKLNEKLPDNSVIVADVGQNQIWTANNVKIQGGRFITSGGMGTMGYSLPAAIGAKTAQPQNEVIAICGDGSFQMQFMELATAVQHNITVKIIVYVNGFLGMVREVQDNVYDGRLEGVSIDGSPDFIKLAAAYGIDGCYVNKNSDIEQSVAKLVSSDKPYIIQINTDPYEKTLL